MAGIERTVLKGIQNPSTQLPLHLEVDETPQFSSVNQVRPKPKVSKFDSWESEENCSVYFDNAGKKKKNSRPVINPGDPQDGDPRADPEKQQSEVPLLALDSPALAKSEARSKVVPQFGVWEGEGEAGYSRWWFGNVWMKIKNWVVNRYKSLINYCLRRERHVLQLQSGWESWDDGNSEFGGPPINYARFPLLDDAELIGERRRSPPMDYGGSRRLIVKQSDNKIVVQTGIASRGLPNPTTGSPTPLEIESNLIQSNVEATSRQVFNNDTPASCHLSIDHLKQEKKIGSWFSWFKRGRKKTSKQG